MTSSPEIRHDGFLGGALRFAQPAEGYRAGADAVMLAAACPARPAERVLELGCGAGVALLCLGWRVRGARLTGVELQPQYAELARENARANDIEARIVTADLGALPAELRAESFDHVIANPPYFLGGTAAPDQGRGIARHEGLALEHWIAVGLRRLRPKGWLTLIQKADRLAEILAALHPAAGTISVLPVAGRVGRDAGRVIVTARKGTRGPLRLLPPFVMHAKSAHLQDGEDLTPEAQAVLRAGEAINRRDI
ncbi:tRNA1(Val) (adenine(37)-N6)-methyltransferase [Paracoccus aminophilus]|uniref:Putative O-methyltransferase n=1 Tax=Paracoccus aminophilus JCM 7686 TaxID=1367847 RepID=S5YQU4_PARAH|nr:methyltransferase domain-containing protein [Paracoccus aminophilus]AGT07621.1 putative O-methyltransferase [Paracoccus aminophilus JCM 7686]